MSREPVGRVVDAELARISQRIRRWREEAGLTLQDLARRSELATSTIQKVETAQMVPSIAVMLKIARGLGRPFVERNVGETIGRGLLGSQNTLTFLVFGSRLLPFLSFDMVSYAAGLSALHLWRFALATLAGIIPASFLLAHLGSEAMNGDVQTATWTALGLGAFTALSVLFAVWRDRRTLKKEI